MDRSCQSSSQLGIHKITSHAAAPDTPLNKLLRQLIRTREVRGLMTAVVSETLAVWAENSRLKGAASKITTRFVKDQLSFPDDVFEDPELSALFKDDEVIEALSDLFPQVVNGLADGLHTALTRISDLPPEDQQALVREWVVPVFKGRAGAMATMAAKIITDIHRDDPAFLAKVFEKGMTGLVESTDFGQIKETADNSVPVILAFAEMVNQAVWRHPAKIVCLFSLAPPLAKIILGTCAISLKKLNELPPDLIADIALVLLKEVDGAVLAGLVNETMEVARKFHTGSALIGEPGAPRLSKDLAEKVQEIFQTLDWQVFWKGRIAVARMKGMVGNAVAEAALASVDSDCATGAAEMINVAVQNRNQRVAGWDEMDDEGFDKTMTDLLSGIDTQELAELACNYLRVANRAFEQTPDAVSRFLGRFVSALDLDEMARAAMNLFESGGDHFKPVARAVLPRLVVWGCHSLQPQDDEFEDDAAAAREALGHLFAAVREEV